MNGKLKAERRDTSSHGELRKIRMSGKVPGVVYGKDMEEPTPVVVDSKQIQAILRTNPHAVLEMEVEGLGSQPVMVTEIQRDTMSREVLHLDFHKINMSETIKSPVRIEITGKAAGEQEGGMLQVLLHELEVESLPNNLPDSIPVNVDAMQVGDHVSVGDLRLPEGVKATLDPDTVIAAVLAPRKERAEDEVDAKDDAKVDASEEDAASPARTGTTADK